MSLINDALKKAQKEQQSGSGASSERPSPSPGTPPPHGGDKATKRSFLWGFIAAVLIVGTVTTLLTTFFVWQILGDPEPNKTVAQERPPQEGDPEPPIESKAQTPAPQSETEDKRLVAAPPATDPSTESAPLTGEPAPPGEEDREMPVVAMQAAPDTDAREPSASSPRPDTKENTGQPKAAPPPAGFSADVQVLPPNPEVIVRLRELEIRGIMSGGSKVLIYDSSTGKTQAFEAGESLSGPMGLEVVTITNSTIQFRDYEGRLHTKSF